MGVLWQGRATVRQRLGPTTPIAGVYAAGAHATPGGGLPFVGPLRRAGRADGRPGAEPQTVTLRAAKISSVALDRLSV